jgi:predicted RND superfamily exporter protein
MAIDLGFMALNETTIIVAVLSIFTFLFYKEAKKLKMNAQHRHVAYELQELRNSTGHANSQRLRHIPVAGRVRGRPLVMAAIQEAKTEVIEHFAKRRFREQKEENHITAS